MAHVSIAGLPGSAGEVPAQLADRLRAAQAVFVADPGGAAAGLLAAAGIPVRPLAELTQGADDLSAALRRSAAGDPRAEVVLVVDGYLPVTPLDAHPAFAELTRIMQILRGPGGCPWDLEQTHATIKSNMIEEAYEAVEAIDEADDTALAEELGDVLLQIAFHAQMAAEAGTFTIDDVAQGIVAKLVFRHPHVFGDVEAGTAADTLRRWDQLKGIEKPHRTSALDGIPQGLPALMAAQKISRRVVDRGFEWEDTAGVYDKLAEEIDELRATEPGTPEAAEEIGDILFTAVNLARRYGVDAEESLRGTNAKFERRWRHMEQAALLAGRSIDDHGIGELEDLWQAAKDKERTNDEA